MSIYEGGCLCGAVRYLTKSQPVRVTFCHCKFCQKATGSAYMVEPVFRHDDFEIITGTPSTYPHRSAGSGKLVTINFCATCGTKLFVAFERFPDVIGVYGGTFDDPNWFERSPDNSKHIFLDAAQKSTVIPSGFDVFHQHAFHNDGSPIDPIKFEKPYTIGSEN